MSLNTLFPGAATARQFVSPTSVAGPTYYLYDTFTELTNAVSADAHTMDVGSGWTLHAAGWEIDNNRLAVANSTTGNGVWADAGHADGTVQVELVTVSGVDMFLLFRAVDDNNFWLFGKWGGDNLTHLFENNAGSFTSRGSYAYTLINGDVIKVILSGSSIDCYVNGVSVITYSSSLHATATFFGVAGTITLGTEFDNFQMTP